MLGHASAAMTLDVYAGLFDDELDEVADRMSTAAEAGRTGGDLRTKRGPTEDDEAGGGSRERTWLLTCADGGAACRNRTDDLLITRSPLPPDVLPPSLSTASTSLDG